MAYRIKKYSVWDKGLVTKLGDESIDDAAAAQSHNWLSRGDRIELMRGSLRLADEGNDAGSVSCLAKGTALDGTERLYKKEDTTLKYYDPSSGSWTNVITGLPASEDLSWKTYRTPAGSFVWFSSPNSGLYRINMANPTTYVDLYDSSKNFKGYITIEDNRMWLWGDEGNEAGDLGNRAILRLSHIDDDWPYTGISSEALDTADGSLTYSGTLAQTLIAANTLVITHSTETFTDADGMGTLTGSHGGTGTINYTTGAWSVTFNSAPVSGAITGDYSYEDPKNDGIADFTYTSPARVAGEGSFFFQGQSDDLIQTVLPYDGVYYVIHTNSIWRVDLTEDDTNATNKIYRQNTGIASRNAAITTGEGVVYLDSSDSGEPTLRILKYDDIGTKVLPKALSSQLDLADAVFDDAYLLDFSEFVILGAKSSTGVSYNDTWWIFNRTWELFDTADALYRNGVVYGGKLYCGSSVDTNAYEVFSGFDDDDAVIPGVYKCNDSVLDTEELKKCKKVVIEGDMATTQELIVDIAFDGEEFNELGRIAGNSEYVDSGATTEYGVALYGGETYGSGENITAYRYMREFKLDSRKFYRAQLRFRTENIGYLNVRQFIFKDIRLKGYKLPSKFR